MPRSTITAPSAAIETETERGSDEGSESELLFRNRYRSYNYGTTLRPFASSGLFRTDSDSNWWSGPNGRYGAGRPDRFSRNDDETGFLLGQADDDDGDDDDDHHNTANNNNNDNDDGHSDEDGHSPASLFDGKKLDSIPIHLLTHTVHELVSSRLETTLSWDQLRSPQVSQFLIKPIQRALERDPRHAAALLYALMANCLQFQHEGRDRPAGVGVSKTRAMTCELLAMRVLRVFDGAQLIDALSYEFDPLAHAPGAGPVGKTGARLSAVEVAVCAGAKRFLAHPVVVGHLQAIWAGGIVFHVPADSFHRERTTDRVVSIYSVREASLFKLSRLRVGRYRQFFTTLSFAIMLGLLTAILARRSMNVTWLEIVFWFFSSGFVLAEIAEFSEQGSGLFFLSYWNVFDLISELLFIVYYTLRVFAVLVPVDQPTREWSASLAYDVLAAAAVLLFPRLFSVLDHYYYFSQLLIALRAMVRDMFAILLLILISCSGFCIAFAFSFRDDSFSVSDSMFSLFQLLMGFTPAAWEMWADMNPLGKAVLVVFLFICHFLIVTVLITVLTNSFMAVVHNAEEEHQFLFAINTLSMVKTDALFSYVPPMNLLGWLLAPVRYVVPFKRFVRLNRQVIKITHLPVLAAILIYERFYLGCEQPVGGHHHYHQLGQPQGEPFRVRNIDRLGTRAASIATNRQALDAVFRSFPKRVSEHELEEAGGLDLTPQNPVHDWIDRLRNDQHDSFSLQSRGKMSRLAGRLTSIGTASAIARSVVSDPDELLRRRVGRMRKLVRPVGHDDGAEADGERDDAEDETDHADRQSDRDGQAQPPAAVSDGERKEMAVSPTGPTSGSSGTIRRVRPRMGRPLSKPNQRRPSAVPTLATLTTAPDRLDLASDLGDNRAVGLGLSLDVFRGRKLREEREQRERQTKEARMVRERLERVERVLTEILQQVKKD